MLNLYTKALALAKRCTTISLGNRASSKTIQRSLCYGSKPDVTFGKNKPIIKEEHQPKINHEALVNRASSIILDLYKTQPDIKKKIFQEYFWNPTVQSSANQVYPVARAFNLSKMTYIGFDYDYTLADYTDELQNLIYNLARNYLVNDMRYPAELLQKSYDPAFPIRGLFYDTKKGNLIKMDFLNNMQIGAVYFGRRPLRQTEIIDAYGGTHINSTYYGNLRPMIDRFALPETCLISDVIEFFVQKKLKFDPSYVYNDITKAVGLIHSTKLLHNEIMKNLPLYLKKDDAAGIATFLTRLKKAGKKLFLLTNSPYSFVDYGMSYILNGQENISDWKQLFDIIIVNGDKPNFFMSDRPFRAFDSNNGAIKWEQVSEFTPSNVYVEGCLAQFNRIVKPKGDSVAYFGDHLFGDAREPSRSSGWRTGVIIRELEQEIVTQNSFEYIDHLRKLVTLEDLRRKFDLLSADPEMDVMNDMELEVQRHRKQLKEMFNKHFGSAFRTFTNATLFAYLLQRYADVYTSKLENFNNYPLDYEFHPRRSFLPHELSLMKDIFQEWSGEGQEIEDF